MKLHSLPYPAYKDSNNEWVAQLPEEWMEKRVKDLFRLVTDSAPKDNDFELLSLYTSIGVKPRKDMEQRGNKSVTTEDYWIVKKGDIIVNKLLAWMGAIGLSDYDGVTSPAYDILRRKRKNKREVDERFCTYLFRTEKAQQIFRKYSRGIMDVRLRLYFDKLGAISVPVPAFITQKAIADYLDAKTTQIDRKIDLLEQKAEKYTALKQSLINETVTRGLDKTVPMKDSGVEWIGQVPAHWEVKRLKEVTTVIMGQSPSSSDYTDQGIGYPFLQGNADFGNYSPTPQTWCSAIKKFAKENDVLLSVRAPVGAVNVAAGFYGIGRVLCAVRSKSNHQFWYYFLTTLPAYLNSIATGSTYLAVSIEDVKNTPTLYPPENEQKAIAEYLDTKTAQIDRIIEIIYAEIEKLKELRKTLINDVVTGKIKVTGRP